MKILLLSIFIMAANAAFQSPSPTLLEIVPGVVFNGTVFRGFHIVNFRSGRCIDVNGFNRDNNGRLDIWDCVSQDNERYDVRYMGDDAFDPILQKRIPLVQIVSKHSGKCMTVFKGETGNNAIVNQYDCVNQSNQSWYGRFVRDTFSTYYQFVSFSSGRCLTVSNGASTNGALLTIYDCIEAGNQLWSTRYY